MNNFIIFEKSFIDFWRVCSTDMNYFLELAWNALNTRKYCRLLFVENTKRASVHIICFHQSFDLSEAIDKVIRIILLHAYMKTCLVVLCCSSVRIGTRAINLFVLPPIDKCLNNVSFPHSSFVLHIFGFLQKFSHQQKGHHMISSSLSPLLSLSIYFLRNSHG